MFNYSCLMNNAYRDNETPHVHFHFRPRYKTTIKVLDFEYTDPNFGEHYTTPNTPEQDVTAPENVRKYVCEEMLKFF